MANLNLKTPILFFFFALSGFCSLVYEVLWTRYLGLTFGTDIVAVSLVAATFMGGLAIGSRLVGRYCDRWQRLWLSYALLELGIALSAFAFPYLLILVEKLYIGGVHFLPERGALTWSFYLVGAAIILLPPTIFMGGTLPVMCRLFESDRRDRQVGFLYGLNTVGATLGVLASGLFLIPTFGLAQTGYIAIGGNLLVAVGVVFLTRREQSEDRVSGGEVGDLSPVDFHPRLLLLVIGCVGFISLGFEIEKRF
mgnify:CR=1 FL=1